MEKSVKYEAGTGDVAVIGAGHAGIEAALACARLGLRTYIFTVNLDSVGNMPCNPSIGGTAKGHLVFEIDALGGEMGRAADAVTIQDRMLNRGKGPAVHSKRVQADRAAYKLYMKKVIEKEENLFPVQGEITEIITDGGAVCGVLTATGGLYRVKAAIVATGTYLRGRVTLGELSYESGPDGMLPSRGLSDSLKKLGIELMRFKTGTPVRVHAGSIDFSGLEEQRGEWDNPPFSADTPADKYSAHPDIPCHIVYTTEQTHKIIRENLDRSPIYSGRIEGTGPRYCPSIEDKVVRFPDKERHQIFLEPVGLDTEEIYFGGFSSSMPAEVQEKMVRSLPGCENAHVMRYAYAIEYDCCNPLELYGTLEFKKVPGLYGAGQFNGTSGYEEAAAQGLMAGINAALKIKGKEQIILPRSSSYIGTLIDDLTVKGTNEPYRMMTSRSEYRLLLRQDNADIRLCEYGKKAGLLPEERYKRAKEKEKNIKELCERAEKKILPAAEADEIIEKSGGEKGGRGLSIAALLRRPEVKADTLEGYWDELPADISERRNIETEIKYAGYISKQLREVKRREQYYKIKLPTDTDYSAISGLRLEARQKLDRVKPENLGKASEISGVSPADTAVLLIWLQGKRHEKKKGNEDDPG